MPWTLWFPPGSAYQSKYEYLKHGGMTETGVSRPGARSPGVNTLLTTDHRLFERTDFENAIQVLEASIKYRDLAWAGTMNSGHANRFKKEEDKLAEIRAAWALRAPAPAAAAARAPTAGDEELARRFKEQKSSTGRAWGTKS